MGMSFMLPSSMYVFLLLYEIQALSSLASFPGAVYKELFKFCLWGENQ